MLGYFPWHMNCDIVVAARVVMCCTKRSILAAGELFVSVGIVVYAVCVLRDEWLVHVKSTVRTDWHVHAPFQCCGNQPEKDLIAPRACVLMQMHDDLVP